MGWQLKTNPKTVRITKKLAAEWADMEAVGTDRPLSESRLAVYRKMLAEGAFRPVAWAKVYIKELGGWYRVNGKHTSTLFSTADTPDGLEVYAVIEEYECETVQEAVDLYATFDSKVQSRNSTDINRQFASVIPELKGMEVKTVNLLVGALNYTPASDSASRTVAEKAEQLFDNVPKCVWLVDVLGSRGKGQAVGFNPLWRVPVAAAMFKTYDKSQKAATDFWMAVRDETGAKPDLPDRKLAKWLNSMRLVTGSYHGTPQRFRTLPREFYVKCITAWNAWRAGEKTELKYFAGAKLPVPR